MAVCARANVSEAHAVLSNIQMHSDVCVCLCLNVCVCVCVVGSYIWYSKSYWPQKDLCTYVAKRITKDEPHAGLCCVPYSLTVWWLQL